MGTQLITFLYTPNGNDKKYLPIAKPVKVHGSDVRRSKLPSVTSTSLPLRTIN